MDWREIRDQGPSILQKSFITHSWILQGICVTLAMSISDPWEPELGDMGSRGMNLLIVFKRL
jgi:hypothetical protein